MKLPATVLLPPPSSKMHRPPSGQPLTTSPRTVTEAKKSRQVDRSLQLSWISGTALIAPVAFVFGCEPVCV
jgi:hypothetical protein